jgi:ankyrin repeat protein
MASGDEHYWENEDQANLADVEAAIADSSLVNQTDPYGDPPLVKAIRLSKPEIRLQYVKALIETGADPRMRSDDGSGDSLFEAVLQRDAVVLELLLSHGANPTYIVDSPESLYDWAEFDYRYEAWELRSPIESTDSDRTSEDSWLNYLDRCAELVGVSKPVHLRVLRKFGALRRSEMDQRSMGSNCPQLMRTKGTVL